MDTLELSKPVHEAGEIDWNPTPEWINPPQARIELSPVVELPRGYGMKQMGFDFGPWG